MLTHDLFALAKFLVAKCGSRWQDFTWCRASHSPSDTSESTSKFHLLPSLSKCVKLIHRQLSQWTNNNWDAAAAGRHQVITKAASEAAEFRRNTCRQPRQARVSRCHRWAAKWHGRGTCETCTHAGDDRHAGSKWSRPLQSLCFCTTQTTPVRKRYIFYQHT